MNRAYSGINYFHQSASNSSTTVPSTTGGDLRLVGVNINTGAASGVVTVHDGGSAGATVAVLNASTSGYFPFYGARMLTGQVTVVTSGGAADVTVTYI